MRTSCVYGSVFAGVTVVCVIFCLLYQLVLKYPSVYHVTRLITPFTPHNTTTNGKTYQDPHRYDASPFPLPYIHSNHVALYPDPAHPWHDRVALQLAYVPKVKPTRVKTILLPSSSQPGAKLFASCRVSQCTITNNISHTLTADLVYFEEQAHRSERTSKVLDILTKSPRRRDQIWAYYNHESPPHATAAFRGLQYNWTVALTPSSVVPAFYGKYVRIFNRTKAPSPRNYAEGKSNKVLWIVSNCNTPNKRMEYAKELARHIPVDIYGRCGKPGCPKFMGECEQKLLANYKFYLAFENTNCETYVTEKLHTVALRSPILPIVMGATPAYYRTVAPPNSVIIAEEFQSPKHLANYLNQLDSDDTLYNSYFRWRSEWREVTEAELALYCRLCAMLHAPKVTTVRTHKQWSDSERCRGPLPIL